MDSGRSEMPIRRWMIFPCICGRATKKGSAKKGSVHEFRNCADDGQASEMWKRGMGVLGINASDFFEAKAQGALGKQVLAWWLRKKTVVSRRWISEKLGMSDLSRVTNGVRKVDTGKESEIWRWKMQLGGGIPKFMD